QCLFENIDHLLAAERLTVLRSGTVKALVQQAQALHHLLTVFGGERLEKLVPLVGKKHECPGCSKVRHYSKSEQHQRGRDWYKLHGKLSRIRITGLLPRVIL